MNREPLNSSSPFAVVVNDDPTQLKVLSGLVRKAGLEPRIFTAAAAALAEYVRLGRNGGQRPRLVSCTKKSSALTATSAQNLYGKEENNENTKS